MLALALLGLFGAPALAERPDPLLAPGGLLWLGTVTPASPPAARVGREEVLVDPDSGGLWVEATDLSLPGLGPPVALRRTLEPTGWRWSCVESLLWTPNGLVWRGPAQDTLFAPDTALDLRQISSTNDFPEGVSFGEGAVVREEEGWVLRSAGEVRTFDEDGHIVRRQDASGAGVRFRYDSFGQLLTLTSDDGRELRFEVDALGQLRTVRAAGAQLHTFDHRDGRLLAVTDDRGARTRYVYDDAGRLSDILWPDASALHVQWGPDGRVARLVGPGPSSLRFDWSDDGFDAVDALGRRWAVRRDPRTVQVTDPAGAVVRAVYADGRLQGWQDPRGLETRLRRDEAGRILSVEAPGSATWRLGWLGQALSSLTDPAGAIWRYTREARGLLSAITSPTGETLGFDRDARGQVLALRRGSNSPLRLERDLAGRLSAVQLPSGAVTRLRRDGRGRVTAIVDPLGNETQLVWREGPEPEQIRTRTGATWVLAHDGRGRIARVETPSGDRLFFRRDGYGRLSSLSLNGESEVSFAWRSDGALTRVTDTLGRAWGVLYDSAARPVQLLRPAGAPVSFARDSLGALTRIDADGESATLTRDPRGNLLELGPWRYTWDSDDRLMSVDGGGVQLRLTRASDGSVRELRVGADAPLPIARDGAGRAVRIGEGARVTTLTREPGGAIVGLSGPETPELRFDRDDAGRLSRVAEGQRVRTALRDAEGRALRWALADGRAASADRAPEGLPLLVRFPDGSLTRLSWNRGTIELLAQDSRGAIVMDHSVRLDALGRAAEVLDGVLTRLHRDPLGLLVTTESDRGVWTRTPGFIESADGTSATLDEAGRPQSAVPPAGPSAWGVGRAELSYRLDELGRISAVRGEDGTQKVRYDGLCRPDRLSAEGQAGRAIRWDVFGRPSRMDHFGAGAVQLVWGLAEPLSATLPDERLEILAEPGWGWTLSGAHTHALHPDASGSPRVWLDDGQLYEPIRWSPTGSSAEHLPLIGWRGTLVLGDGGPYLDGLGGWDPLSGTPLCPRYSAPGVLPKSSPAPWPQLDGASSPPWDPTPWQSDSIWRDPLALLVALGELPPLDAEPWLPVRAEPPPLPWLPAVAATPDPPLWGPREALPLEVDPITALLLRAGLPGGEPVSTRAVLETILDAELGDQPLFATGTDPRLHRWWEDILLPGQIIGLNETLDY